MDAVGFVNVDASVVSSPSSLVIKTNIFLWIFCPLFFAVSLFQGNAQSYIRVLDLKSSIHVQDLPVFHFQAVLRCQLNPVLIIGIFFIISQIFLHPRSFAVTPWHYCRLEHLRFFFHHARARTASLFKLHPLASQSLVMCYLRRGEAPLVFFYKNRKTSASCE